MIKAILLDLDNTLLHNPDKVFAYEFLRQIDAHFQAQTGYENAHRAFRQAIQQMCDGTLHTRSNYATTQQIFIEALQAETTLSDDDIRQTLHDFFEQGYTQLAHCIQPVEGAAALIHALHAQDIALVIATNPIYPTNAIKQRMMWGQLPLDDDLYAFITGADVMHYAKPDPAYYAEILARVGVEPDEALMLGDGLRNDITPAQQLGIYTYHVTDDHIETIADRQGTVAQFAQWVQNADWDDIAPLQLHPAMIAPQYRGHIGALLGLLAQTTPDDWHKRPIADEWSILQILCHLRDSETATERERLQRIRTQDNPFIIAPKPPGPNLPLCDDDAYRIAHQFIAERRHTLDFIAQLSPPEWQRPARHSIFGLTTLIEMAHFTARHDRLHLNQLCQTIGRCRI